MQKSKAHTSVLSLHDLHSCLRDPVLHSIGFLNEIIDRYPHAISLAPGAPNSIFFKEIDFHQDLERFNKYLKTEKGFPEEKIDRILYQYGPSSGQINEILSRSISIDEGFICDPSAIVVTVGCQEAIFLTLRALFHQSCDVLGIINPSFVGAAGAASVLGLKVIGISVLDHNGKLDIELMRQICQSLHNSGQKLKVLYLAPDFSNPKGVIMDLASRNALLLLAQEEDFFILEDNTYRFFYDHEDAIPSLKALDKDKRVIYTGTFSKICFPGVRVGFVLADQIVFGRNNQKEYLAYHMAAIKNMITVNTSPICQAIVAGSLLSSDVSSTKMSNNKRDFYRNNLKLMIAAVDKYFGSDPSLNDLVSWNVPLGGFFVILRVPFVVNHDALVVSAEKYGVIWTPMSSFYVDDTAHNEIRLSCSYLNPSQIDRGLRNLAAFVRDFHSKNL